MVLRRPPHVHNSRRRNERNQTFFILKTKNKNRNRRSPFGLILKGKAFQTRKTKPLVSEFAIPVEQDWAWPIKRSERVSE